MIKVNLIKNRDQIIGLEISGHGDTASYGKDLLCAAVSAIVTGGFNAFNEEDIKSISLEEGYAHIEVSTQNGINILNVIIVQLKTIQEVYPQNIEIK